MRYRSIGSRGVSCVGLGAMLLSLESRPEEDEAIRVIHSALDAGITLIDSADAYCLNSEEEHGHNERLIKKALDSYEGDKTSIIIATKGGKRKPSSGEWPVNGDPNYLKAACEQSLVNLGVDSIDLYQLHAPDPNFTITESVGALAELQAQGKIKDIGLSNVNVEQITEALGVAPIVSVQNSFSYVNRSDKEVLDLCSMFGLAYLSYSPLGGRAQAKSLSNDATLSKIAARHDATNQEIALAWLLLQSESMIPIPSATKIETVQSIARASDLVLSAEDIAELS